MESQLAHQLSEMLKQAESREASAKKLETSCADRLRDLDEREKAMIERAEQIHRDAIALEEFRNVSAEREKTQNMMRQLKHDEAMLTDQRQLHAKEYADQNSLLHKMKVELSEWKDRLAKKEADLVADIELLKQEKIKHHEQVLADLADIEAKKREVVNANI